jgi:hypothetical protein
MKRNKENDVSKESQPGSKKKQGFKSRFSDRINIGIPTFCDYLAWNFIICSCHCMRHYAYLLFQKQPHRKGSAHSCISLCDYNIIMPYYLWNL